MGGFTTVSEQWTMIPPHLNDVIGLEGELLAVAGAKGVECLKRREGSGLAVLHGSWLSAWKMTRWERRGGKAGLELCLF